jgi:hypothetical protein
MIVNIINNTIKETSDDSKDTPRNITSGERLGSCSITGNIGSITKIRLTHTSDNTEARTKIE